MSLKARQIFDTYIAQPQNRYRQVATLEGHSAPVNCLTFNREGSVLASAGDDQKIILWDTKTLKRSQILIDQNARWGQITCLGFIDGPTGEHLCFGTGRGSILLFKKNKRSVNFTEVSSAHIFPSSDSVEDFDYCKLHHRLVATSHFGLIKMFRFDGIELKDLWSVEMPGAIPRAVYFSDKGESTLVYGMENGLMSVRDSETAAEKFTKVLKSAIGNVSVSVSGRSILVDNMTTGFDLYWINRSVPKQTFLVRNSRRFVKNGLFGEGGNTVVCGSDHGRAYIFNVNDRGDHPIQVLQHRSSTALIQAIGTTTLRDAHCVATGAAENNYEIHVWLKPLAGASRGSGNMTMQFFKYTICIIIAILFCASLSQPWVLKGVKNTIYKHADHRLFPEAVHNNIGHHLFLESSLKKLLTIEELYNLDEVELKKLLGLRKMTEEDARHMLGGDAIAEDDVKAGENANPENKKVEEAKETIETKLDSKSISLKY